MGATLCVFIWTTIVLEYNTQMEVTFSIVIFICTFQMPLVVAFTVKHRKKTSMVNPMVPRTLQFHEEDEKSEV